MFDRKAYKKNALVQLKGQWLDALLLSVIFLVLTGLSFCAGPVIFAGVYGILSVAISCVFLRKISSSTLLSFDSFLDSLGTHWLPSLLAGLWYLLWLFLWSLLFFFPALVKFYSYSMMFSVLSENPKIGVEKAMNISKILTHNHKANLFMLDLSFLGWFILCVFTSGIGFVALFPYYKMTKMNAYLDLKKMAFNEGKLSPADFM